MRLPLVPRAGAFLERENKRTKHRAGAERTMSSDFVRRAKKTLPNVLLVL